MAADDERVEASLTSLFIGSLEANQSGDVLSPEDAAWVDSCIVKEPEISDLDWSSVKDALREMLTWQPESLNSTLLERDALSDMKIPPSDEHGVVVLPSSRTNDDSVPETERNKDELIEEGDDGVLSSRLFQGDLSEVSLQHAFLPTYKEEDDQRMSIPIDSDFSTGFWENEMEPLSEEGIFRVWDLGIPAEEDDLVEQLNKALSESSVQYTPSTFDDSGALKDLKDASLDSVIAGIGELSLNRQSD